MKADQFLRCETDADAGDFIRAACGGPVSGKVLSAVPGCGGDPGRTDGPSRDAPRNLDWKVVGKRGELRGPGRPSSCSRTCRAVRGAGRAPDASIR